MLPSRNQSEIANSGILSPKITVKWHQEVANQVNLPKQAQNQPKQKKENQNSTHPSFHNKKWVLLFNILINNDRYRTSFY